QLEGLHVGPDLLAAQLAGRSVRWNDPLCGLGRGRGIFAIDRREVGRRAVKARPAGVDRIGDLADLAVLDQRLLADERIEPVAEDLKVDDARAIATLDAVDHLVA